MITIPECNLCGKNSNILNKVEIEGSVIEVCNACTKFGNKITINRVYRPVAKPIKFEIEKDDLEIIPEFGKYIKLAREKKGLTIAEFANKINEKESVLKRIEASLMEPNEELLKKIEKFLNINLRTKYEEKLKRSVEKKEPNLTLGDIAKVE